MPLESVAPDMRPLERAGKVHVMSRMSIHTKKNTARCSPAVFEIYRLLFRATHSCLAKHRAPLYSRACLPTAASFALFFFPAGAFVLSTVRSRALLFFVADG